jgi:hypothetical protein
MRKDPDYNYSKQNIQRQELFTFRQHLGTVFVTRLTRRVPLVEQELLIPPEHVSSPSGFSGVRVTRSLVLCVLCRSLFVLLHVYVDILLITSCFTCMLIFFLLQAVYMYVDILLITSCIHVCWYSSYYELFYMYVDILLITSCEYQHTCIQLVIRRISTYMYTACNKKNINIHVKQLVIRRISTYMYTAVCWYSSYYKLYACMLIFFVLQVVCMYVDILLITSCMHVCWYSSYYKLYTCMFIFFLKKNINIHVYSL